METPLVIALSLASEALVMEGSIQLANAYGLVCVGRMNVDR